MSAAAAAAKAAMFARLADAWPVWCKLGPARAWFVPGRVELLGKHTDYAGGRSLLCAVERGFCLLAAPRRDRLVRLRDVATGEEQQFSIGDDPPATWARYPAIVARRLATDDRLDHGADIVFASDLPPAAGMSSSSALVVASFLALGGEVGAEGREALAAYLAAAEVGVGTHGGSEDHTAILCSQPGVWSQYRFRPTQCESTLPAPRDMTLVIAASGVVADKSGAARNAYNHAAASTSEIVALWNQSTGRQDTTLAAVLSSSAGALARLQSLLSPRPALRVRLDQFWNETEVWIPGAAAAARSGGWPSFGECVSRSQAAAETALGNQTPETLALVASARALGAVAASSFGAGFGGSVWALVSSVEAVDFRRAWQEQYHRAFAVPAAASLFFESAAGPAVLEIACV